MLGNDIIVGSVVTVLLSSEGSKNQNITISQRYRVPVVQTKMCNSVSVRFKEREVTK